VWDQPPFLGSLGRSIQTDGIQRVNNGIVFSEDEQNRSRSNLPDGPDWFHLLKAIANTSSEELISDPTEQVKHPGRKVRGETLGTMHCAFDRAPRGGKGVVSGHSLNLGRLGTAYDGEGSSH
jgi:hypothetical protein